MTPQYVLHVTSPVSLPTQTSFHHTFCTVHTVHPVCSPLTFVVNVTFTTIAHHIFISVWDIPSQCSKSIRAATRIQRRSQPEEDQARISWGWVRRARSIRREPRSQRKSASRCLSSRYPRLKRTFCGSLDFRDHVPNMTEMTTPAETDSKEIL